MAPTFDEDDDGDNNAALVPMELLLVVVFEDDGAAVLSLDLDPPSLVPPLEELPPLCLDSVDVEDWVWTSEAAAAEAAVVG